MQPEQIKALYEAAPIQLQVAIYAIYGILDILVGLGVKLVYDGIKSPTIKTILNMLVDIKKDNTDARVIAREERLALVTKFDSLDKRVDEHETRLCLIESTVCEAKCKEVKKIDVLVVDDEPLVSDTYSQMLGEIGCRCSMAATREEAEKILRSKPFDLMIIDLFLKDCDGFELYKYCQNAYPNLKYIIYSGQSPKNIPTEISSIFLEKPIKLEVLESKINNVLG